MSQTTDNDMDIQHSDLDIEEQLRPVQSILSTLQAALSLILGFSSLVLFTGFIIVNMFLARFTDIHGFSILPQQYIAAGFLYVMVWVVVAIAFRIWPFGVNFFWESIPEARVVRMLQASLKGQYERRNKLQEDLHLAILRPSMFVHPEFQMITPPSPEDLEQNKAEVAELSEKLANVKIEIGNTKMQLDNARIAFRSKIGERGLRVFGKETVLLLTVSIIYGLFVYPIIPHVLGGGKPATIILNLHSDYPASTLRLSSSSNQTTTGSLLLFAELTDGLLVADPSTGQFVVVKNEAIIGIIDDNIVSSLIESTSTPTPTNTPTSTATIVFTPTP